LSAIRVLTVLATALLESGILLPGAFAADGPLPTPDTSRSADRYWILLQERPDRSPGSEQWAAPVAPSYRARLQALGVRPVIESRWFHAVSAALSSDQRARVASLPFVRRVEPVAGTGSRTKAPAPDPLPMASSGPPSSPLQPGASREPLARINALDPMEQGLDGRGVRVGFLDAHYRGLRHPAFAALRREDRVIALRDFTDGTQSGNHGMGVVSVAMGRAPGTLVGPAHGAELLAATTEYTPSERNVEEDYFVAGLEWLHRRGADVVNVSIGYNTFDEGQDDYSVEDLDGDTGLTSRAVDRAAQLGVTVVVSAGNSGCATPDSCWYYVNTPADADSAITVGAVKPDSTLASFSSRGPTADGRRTPDVVVQGTDVPAAWNGGQYAQVGGTSFASPQVTGVVAQMLQVNPALSPTEVRMLLRRTASQAHSPDNRTGWGIVDATAAVDAAEWRARRSPPSTLSVESPFPNPASDHVTLPVRMPEDTPSIDLSLRTPWGAPVIERTYAVRPGPNWVTIDVSRVPSGIYRYRVRGGGYQASGTLGIDR